MARAVARDGLYGAMGEGAGDLDLVGRAGKRRGLVESCGRVELPGDRSYPGEGDSNPAVEARGGNADDRKRPLPPVHRLEVGGRVSRRNVELEDELVRSEGRDVAVVVRRQPVELRDRKLTPRCAQGGAKREQRRRDVRRVSGRALLVAEDRVLAVRAVSRKALLAAMQPAVEAQPPVPTSCRLQEIAADRPHRAQLRRSCLRARFAQRLRDPRIDLELGQCRARADAGAVYSARDDVADVHERVGSHEAVSHERDKLRPARERARAVAQRAGGFFWARRPQELHCAPSRAPAPHAARATSLRG